MSTQSPRPNSKIKIESPRHLNNRVFSKRTVHYIISISLDLPPLTSNIVCSFRTQIQNDSERAMHLIRFFDEAQNIVTVNELQACNKLMEGT